jgi:hypothetical protein
MFLANFFIDFQLEGKKIWKNPNKLIPCRIGDVDASNEHLAIDLQTSFKSKSFVKFFKSSFGTQNPRLVH